MRRNNLLSAFFKAVLNLAHRLYFSFYQIILLIKNVKNMIATISSNIKIPQSINLTKKMYRKNDTHIIRPHSKL